MMNKALSFGKSMGQRFSSAPFSPTSAMAGGFSRPLEGLGSLKPAGQWGQMANRFSNMGVAQKIPSAMTNEFMKSYPQSAWSSFIPKGVFGETKMAGMEKEAFGAMARLFGRGMKAAPGIGRLGSEIRAGGSMGGAMRSGMQGLAKVPGITPPMAPTGPIGLSAMSSRLPMNRYPKGNVTPSWRMEGINSTGGPGLSALSDSNPMNHYPKSAAYHNGFSSELTHILTREMEKTAFMLGAGAALRGVGKAVQRAPGGFGRALNATGKAFRGAGEDFMAGIHGRPAGWGREFDNVRPPSPAPGAGGFNYEGVGGGNYKPPTPGTPGTAGLPNSGAPRMRANVPGTPVGGAGGGLGDMWSRFQTGVGNLDNNSWYGKAIHGPGGAGMTPAQRGQVGAGRLGIAGGGLGLLGANGAVNAYGDARRRDAIRGQNRFGLALGALMGGPEGVINQLHL